MNILILIFSTILYSLKLTGVMTRNASHHMEDHWKNFKHRYNKTYDHPAIEQKKRQDWEENYKLVQDHNKKYERGEVSYKLHLNHLADLNSKQYHREVIQLRKSRRKPPNNEITTLSHHNHSALPESLDWRKEGFNTTPQNQDECGSCYAFSVAACIQGQYFKTRHEIEYFSVQQLVDCSTSTGNLGCAGGSLRNTLKYVQAALGIMLENDYPYTAKQGLCNYQRHRAAAKLKTWGILPPKDEHALQMAVVFHGPVAVSVNASPKTFQLYSRGIYHDTDCSSEYVNHAMLLVGYTKDAWIVKNWWTEQWGYDGYMYLKRGENRCAIANYAAYATIH